MPFDPGSFNPASWQERVRFDDEGGSGYAYRPAQVIVRGGGDAIVEWFADKLHIDLGSEPGESNGDGAWLVPLDNGVDVPFVVATLRDDGFAAEPNHVLFSHVGANPLYGNPLYGNPLYGNPLYGNPLYGNPVYGNPLYGNPLYGNPLYGNPLYGNPLYGNAGSGCCCSDSGPMPPNPYRETGMRPSSARPATARVASSFHGDGQVHVVVFDTGLAGKDIKDVVQCPDLLTRLYESEGNDRVDVPDLNGDRILDPAAGHGTFIAGVVELLCPSRDMTVRQVLTNLGDGDAWTIAHAIRQETYEIARQSDPSRTIFNLSFGGYAPEEMRELARVIRQVRSRGIVVVASAGNDGTCRESYPACLPGVVSVAALSPYGPASFTNHGSWVRACAPGVDVTSAFFVNFNGPASPVAGTDPDLYANWARWSGTSFAAPAVVAALAREMASTGCTAREAVATIIDAAALLRLPELGTVVNIA